MVITFPNLKDKIQFNPQHHCRKMRVSFAIYADFECFTKFTDAEHRPSGFGYFIISGLGDCKYIEYTKRFEDEDIAKINFEIYRMRDENLVQ